MDGGSGSSTAALIRHILSVELVTLMLEAASYEQTLTIHKRDPYVPLDPHPLAKLRSPAAGSGRRAGRTGAGGLGRPGSATEEEPIHVSTDQ